MSLFNRDTTSSHADHPYHLVNPSPWPALGSFALLLTMIGALMFMHNKTGGGILTIVGFSMILYTMLVWWRDVIKEGIHDKAHTKAVSRGLRVGMALFILSEVMFFVAFFWSFFSASTLPRLPLEDVWAISVGAWPPEGIKTFDPMHLPFLNTLILLLSGTTVTWAHHAILKNDQKTAVTALWYTVILGVSFTCLQAFEYNHAAFGFKDGVYASNFFMATGFHGFHVLVGTIFLAICLIRAKKNQFTPEQHLGFEFAAWYWHFVDVVWLFLFLFIYLDFANVLMPAFNSIFTGTNILYAFVISVIGAIFAASRVLKNAKKPVPKIRVKKKH
jgi:cytochrome c oxidase subunit 3